ncbi:MAG: aminoacyl--tRNA ligase-related protein [Candidatus Aenigmatarchaeota archaeon]
MRQSELFYKTYKELPKGEESMNAILLIRAGFIEKVSSGIYNILPLGLKVINKIENIIREELNKIGCQELYLASLHPRENWEKTKRWETFNALFKTKSKTGAEYALAPTHEEVIFPLLKNIIKSYKDLPIALYQINNKYRDELRAKSGILRGKEFIMKDLYSFHRTNEETEKFKNIVDNTYKKIFKRCGLNAIKTFASGGTFSKYSTEFQVPTKYGEDTVLYCEKCKIGWNKEIHKNKTCKFCSRTIVKLKTIEVGNTFNLGTKYSEAFNLNYIDKDNKEKPVYAGCYGIGVTRLMGAIVEVYNDENGIIWPESVAPFKIHIVDLKPTSNIGEKLYKELSVHFEVLYDDRKNISAGEKFVESDLIGIPFKIVIGEKTLKYKKVDIKKRNEKKYKEINIKDIKKWLK